MGGVEDDYCWVPRRRWSYYDDYNDEDDNKGGWHELHGVYKRSVRIKRLADLGGRLLRSGIKIDDEELAKNLIPKCDDPSQGVKERSEDYEGYMGQLGSDRDPLVSYKRCRTGSPWLGGRCSNERY
ncbi:hypothetical protein VTK56DRAFT_8655 [Thermocarpiscus australiensis]